MKKIIYLLFIALSTPAISNTIEIDGNEFNVQKLGKAYMVTNISPTLTVHKSINGDHSRVYEVNCNEISNSIEKLARRIQRCSNDGQSTSCKYTKERIFEYAKENFNLYETPSQFFKIQHTILENTNLVDKIAKKLRVQKELVKIQTELSSNFEIHGLELISDENSLTKKVSSLNLFDQDDISQHYYNQYLRVDNRLVYCDLINNNAQIKVNIKNEIQNTEKVPAAEKDFGNKIYRSLLKHKINLADTKLIQAANLGFLIGSKLEGNKHGMNIKSVFQSMITDKHRNLEVIKFSNQSNLEEAVYPDKTYSKDINQKFNVIIK